MCSSSVHCHRPESCSPVQQAYPSAGHCGCPLRRRLTCMRCMTWYRMDSTAMRSACTLAPELWCRWMKSSVKVRLLHTWPSLSLTTWNEVDSATGVLSTAPGGSSRCWRGVSICGAGQRALGVGHVAAAPGTLPQQLAHTGTKSSWQAAWD